MKKLPKGFIVQLILLIILVILMILTIINKMFLPYADFLAGVIFFVMAYNKKETYSKPLLITMIVLGVLFLGLGVFNIING